jgi:hypothetical protein
MSRIFARSRIPWRGRARGQQVNLSQILKLVLICFVVGLVLSFLGINPVNIWRDFGGVVRDAWDAVIRIGERALKYVLLGAVIVVPIVAVNYAIKYLKRR